MQKSMQNSKINTILCGKSEETLKEYPDNFFDSIITDPPYELNFMSRKWDASGIAYSVKLWKEVLRTTKPGAYLFCFGGTRTHHRVACAIEDAGWQIKDQMMWLYGCLSEDTEILTTKGWRKYNEIERDNIVFSLDMKNDILVKSRVNGVFKYNHIGKMVSLKNHNTDQLVTLNHKVISKAKIKQQISYIPCWHTDKKWKYRVARQIKSQPHTLPIAGKYDGNYSIGDDFAEVIGWILSEGMFHKDTNAITIYQSSINDTYITRIRRCLKAAKINYSEGQRIREYKGREYIEYNWYIGGEDATRIKDIIPNKKPTNKLWDLKLSEKERLIFGLCAGDGTKSKIGIDKYSAFCQYDIEVLNWFQIMLHLTGKQGWINEKKMSCSIHYNATTQIQGKHNRGRIVDYKGIVWCINTDMGNFIARRKGKIFITGNSGFPKSTDISKQIDKEAGIKREKKRYDASEVGNFKGRQDSRPWIDKAKQLGYHETEGDQPITYNAKLWNGHGTALKPAWEPIIMAMKPLEEGLTYAQNAQKYGVAGLNIDGGRVQYISKQDKNQSARTGEYGSSKPSIFVGESQIMHGEQHTKGRWPANVILSHSPDCVCVGTKTINEGAPAGGYTYSDKEYKIEGFVKDCKPQALSNRGQETIDVWACVPDCPVRIMDTQSGQTFSKGGGGCKSPVWTESSVKQMKVDYGEHVGFLDSGGASRFFYTAKACRTEREAGLREFIPCEKCGDFNSKTHIANGEKENCIRNTHPTVKPSAIIEYLIKLIKMPEQKINGKAKQIILDPFCGSGTTLAAAEQMDLDYVGIDQDMDSVLIANNRIGSAGQETIESIYNEKSDSDETIDIDIDNLSSEDFADLIF